MKKINIVLVHGAWGDGSQWRYIIPILASKGYTVRAVQLPLSSLAEDIQRTSDLVASLEGPSLLVGHSYGGMVISAAGNHPNVKGLVYLAAMAPDKGEPAGGLLQINPPAAGAAAIAPGASGLLYVDYNAFHEAYCQDASASDALVLAAAQKPINGAIFGEPAGEPAWKEKPSWYQISENDRILPATTEAYFAKRINARKTVILDAGHASMVSAPEEVAKLIVEAAEAVS